MTKEEIESIEITQLALTHDDTTGFDLLLCKFHNKSLEALFEDGTLERGIMDSTHYLGYVGTQKRPKVKLEVLADKLSLGECDWEGNQEVTLTNTDLSDRLDAPEGKFFAYIGFDTAHYWHIKSGFNRQPKPIILQNLKGMVLELAAAFKKVVEGDNLNG